MPGGRGPQNGSTSGLDEVWQGGNGLSKAIDDIFQLEFNMKRKISKCS